MFFNKSIQKIFTDQLKESQEIHEFINAVIDYLISGQNIFGLNLK